jgi:hypothetical protein
MRKRQELNKYAGTGLALVQWKINSEGRQISYLSSSVRKGF